MGWNSWNHFGCSVSEADVRAAADAIVAQGLLQLGYRYVNLDDCWQASHRDRQGRLAADSTRFPSGIKSLAQYVHSRGLLFGIYATPGRFTCGELYNHYAGQLGSLGHETVDARTFADWGVDYLKYDWCRADQDGVNRRGAFAKMRRALDETGRPIALSIHDVPEQPVPGWRPSVANLWRTTKDIKDSWLSMIATARESLPTYEHASRGHWNDPDMLEVGNGGMTQAEYRTHFSLWAMMAAPLLLGNDLSDASKHTLSIVGNAAVIVVDQDAEGKQGRLVCDSRGQLIVAKRLSHGDVAISLTNTTSSPLSVSTSLKAAGIREKGRFTVSNLWTGERSISSLSVSAIVQPHDTAMFRVSLSNVGPARSVLLS